jgi:hypothetical protein
VRKSALLRSLDVASQVTFVDAAGKGDVNHAVHLTAPDGREVTGPDLTRAALGELVLLRPVRWLGYVPRVHATVNACSGGETGRVSRRR